MRIEVGSDLAILDSDGAAEPRETNVRYRNAHRARHGDGDGELHVARAGARRRHRSYHRSDIFSFGLILYGLLSGKRAFVGDTSVETMTAILKQDPPELPESVRHECLCHVYLRLWRKAAAVGGSVAASWSSSLPASTTSPALA